MKFSAVFFVGSQDMKHIRNAIDFLCLGFDNVVCVRENRETVAHITTRAINETNKR